MNQTYVMEIRCFLKLLIACIILFGVCAASSQHFLNNTKCMRLYRENISAFDMCKNHPCLVFKEDKPFVTARSKSFPRYPFKCKDSQKKYKQIFNGSFFTLIAKENIPSLEEAYCIFSGEECSFDNQIEFLSYARSMNRSHQFMVTGIMFIMSYRVNNDSIPSIPFTNGPILVIGPLKSRFLSFSEALQVVSGPLEPLTWTFIMIILSFFAMARLVISFSFTVQFTWLSFWWNIWGEYDTAEMYAYYNTDAESDIQRFRVEENNERLRFYNKYWAVSVKLFLFHTVLLYELALCNLVSETMSRPPYRSIEELQYDEMRKFVLVQDSGFERYFRLAADAERKYENSNQVPWLRVQTLEEAYQSIITNGTFSISFDWSLTCEMKRTNICDSLTYYETNAKRSYNAGWYYSVDVPEKTRKAIDEALSELVDEGKVNKILDEGDGTAYRSCWRDARRNILFLLFLNLIIMPLIIMTAICLRKLIHETLKVLRSGLRNN